MSERRPSWDQTHFALADVWAKRSTCPRLAVGAVLVNPLNIPICAGYNGAIRGAPHCSDVGCLLVEGHCLRAVHGEQNAISQAARLGIATNGATLYVTNQPCLNCANSIIQAGIVTVRLRGTYGDQELFREVLKKFLSAKIKVYRHDFDGVMETWLT